MTVPEVRVKLSEAQAVLADARSIFDDLVSDIEAELIELDTDSESYESMADALQTIGEHHEAVQNAEHFSIVVESRLCDVPPAPERRPSRTPSNY